MRPALKDLNCCRRHLVGVLSASFTNSTSLFCASSFVVDKSKHCNMFKNLGSIYRHGVTQPLIANDKKPSLLSRSTQLAIQNALPASTRRLSQKLKIVMQLFCTAEWFNVKADYSYSPILQMILVNRDVLRSGH